MNRRKKKKPQSVDYLSVLKEKYSSINWPAMKDQVKEKWNLFPKMNQRALMVMVPVVLLLLLIPFPEQQTETIDTEPKRVSIDINAKGLSEQTLAGSGNVDTTSNEWKEYRVKSGDTLAQVFRSSGLPMSDLNALVKVEGADKPLSYIKKGQLVRYKLNAEGKLDILQLEKSDQSVMFFRLSDGGFGRSK
ncbi:LysM-like peptidoglycan-binding domain-containing protein [Vibrio japonicus]|uniref:Lysine transporter LysM n=1 Tax=Vibrio japonicus TaxID=1824638 RepID=A0ABY5LKT6_9VIBR|nr:LysM-like peptidoglycan-binding domain-containing protein [Vibrio japonicus]UUM30365.1 lysine transporter LysM [Vibrio japonicus]